MDRPDAGVVDLVHTEAGLSGEPRWVRNWSRDGDEKAKGNHQAELDAALTRALAVTLR